MKMPEIIFDAPTRIYPGRPVPLFLFIKDARLYPVKLSALTVQAIYDNGVEKVARFPYHDVEISDPFWWDAINFMPEHYGTLRIVPTLTVKIGKRERMITVDNYKGSEKSPLLTHIARDPLPATTGWSHGDMHVHSLLTSDQIEFGAPLEALSLAAHAMGIDWVATADHSYDLDDDADDYLKQDPQHKKWQYSRYIADLLNDTFTVIPGEEVTCRTKDGKNCHMLALNAERFIPGSGDGGEKGFDTSTEHTVAEAASICVEWGGIAVAAHPLEKATLAEKLVLNRGKWTEDDLANQSISSLQIYNGVRDKGFHDGKKYWISELLKGRRIPISGGSDAHGDLNRQRAVHIPFFSVTDRREHSFASVRTIVRTASLERNDIINSLQSGHSVVSDGPFIELVVFSENVTAEPGDSVSGGAMTSSALCISSVDFGEIFSAIIIAGLRDGGGEIVIADGEKKPNDYALNLENSIVPDQAIYVRAECETVLGKLCLTNPVWLEMKL